MKYVYIRIDLGVWFLNLLLWYCFYLNEELYICMYVCVYVCNKMLVIFVRIIYVIIYNENLMN